VHSKGLLNTWFILRSYSRGSTKSIWISSYKVWICYHFNTLPWTHNFAKWYYGYWANSSSHFENTQSYLCSHFEELHWTM
jgi:hypothetical protein